MINIFTSFFYYFVKWPTKAQLQLTYKLSRSYMFQHCRVFLRQLVISTSPSYTSISNAAVGNKFKIKKFHIGFMHVIITFFEISTL